MLGKAIFARRTGQLATTPSSQHELGLPISSPSAFAQKFRKFKQELYLMTHHFASFDRRPHGSYPSLPPVVTSSPPFQPGEEAVATSAPSTTSSTFLADPTLLPLPRSIGTTPPLALLAFLTLPALHTSSHSRKLSPRLQRGQLLQSDVLTQPVRHPHSSTIPQHHTHHGLLRGLSHFPHSEQTKDDRIAARKTADLHATIATLQLKRDNYCAHHQHLSGVRVWQKKRDDQMKELEWAKAELAKRTEVRDIMEAMWCDQREERWQLDDARAAKAKAWQEKLKRCEELEREVQRLLFQQEQWVTRGWRRRDWQSDGEPYSGPTSEVSPGPYSASPTPLQQSPCASDSSDNSRSQGAPSTAPMPKWIKQGPFAEAARQGPSTQGSDSIESELLGATTRTHPRACTSQPIRDMLEEFGQQTKRPGSRQGSDLSYDDCA
ncbi:hypothetical protein FRC00_000922 [Tulasnella sp. 408]|nr:hypothetical protein FRC00_000922 [Tulasnella sp. 408]